MSKKILSVVSYIMVALLSATIAICAMILLGGTTIGQSKLEAAEQLILDRFIGSADKTKLEDAAIEAMLSATGDRWSYYISAEEAAAHREQKDNSYVGIGVAASQRQDGNGLKVVSVMAGGGAQQVGMLAGDIIVAVDGRSIAGMAAETIRGMVRGDENTVVEITVVRDGAEQKFSITRKRIQVPVATAQLLEGNIGLVTIANFNNNSAAQTIAAIEQLREEGAQKLIFDVRYNPGGSVSELVDMLDYLLPEGIRVFTAVDYKGTRTEQISDANYLDMPMAVVVNSSSYSAAEYFAAALRESDAAVVVGEQTTGKGYYQAIYRLSDGSAIALYIGKYYTHNGVSLEGVGLVPDVLKAVDGKTAAAIRAGTLNPMEDPQILAAIEALK